MRAPSSCTGAERPPKVTGTRPGTRPGVAPALSRGAPCARLSAPWGCVSVPCCCLSAEAPDSRLAHYSPLGYNIR